MQVNCSELVVVVPGDAAEQVLRRALGLARVVGGVHVFLDGYDAVREELLDDPRAEAPTIILLDDYPAQEDVAYAEYTDYEGKRMRGLVLRGADVLPPRYRDIVDPARLRGAPLHIGYVADLTPYIVLEYDPENHYALRYEQHYQPELYPIIAQISYEYRAPITTPTEYDVFMLDDIEGWLRDNGIKFVRSEKILWVQEPAIKIL